MSKEPTKQSAYADFIYNEIERYFLEQGSAFTIKEISDFMGLKVTGNLRRRINHCVAKGTLSVTTALMGRKGRGNVFYRPTEKQMEGFPF